MWPQPLVVRSVRYSLQATGAYGSPTIAGSSSVGNLIGQWTHYDNSNPLIACCWATRSPLATCLAYRGTAVGRDALSFSYNGSSTYNLGPWVYGKLHQFSESVRPLHPELPQQPQHAERAQPGSASNSDLTGRVTLSAGAATYTLIPTSARSRPNCLTADVTTTGKRQSRH